MQNELLVQGLNLLVLGMGVVFIFLALLVITTSVMSRMIQRYLPEPIPAASVEDHSASRQNALPDEKILAAIKAALEQHRSR